MKIIKSILTAVVLLGTANAIHAQEQQVKTEIAKPAEVTVPAPGSKPAMAPDLKVDTKNNPTFKQSAAQPALTAPTQVNNDVQVTTPLVKPTVKLVDEKASTTASLNAENLKTLNGTTERPKQAAALANDQNMKPLQLAAPAVIKPKEN
jgi:hypothetical protein